MMLLALTIALVSGVLLAILVSKAIRLKLWKDIAAGMGAMSGALYSAKLLENDAWLCMLFMGIGSLLVAGHLYLKKTHQ